MRAILAMLPVLLFVPPLLADVTMYTSKQEWLDNVSTFHTITFQGYPNNTVITNQYTHLGIRFTDGADFIYFNQNFLNDGVGLRGGIPASVTMEFNVPQRWAAIEFLGSLRFRLFFQGQMFFQSPLVGSGNPGNFAGVVSDTAFDKLILLNDAGFGVSIDDLYFGPIPAPGALPLLGVVVTCGRSRRRRSVT